MIKEAFSVAISAFKKAEHVCEAVFQKHIAPFISRHAKSDDDVKRVAGLAYRFIPFIARFVVSKDRFEEFVLKRVRMFVKPESETATL